MTGTNLNTMLQAYDYAVIVSASKVDDGSVYDMPLRNKVRTHDLEASLNAIGLKYYPVQGMYRGSEEQSFLVFCNDYYDVSRVTLLGLQTHKQESVLILDLLKECALLQYKDMIAHLGRGLVQVDKEIAINVASYSVIDNNYWIVE